MGVSPGPSLLLSSPIPWRQSGKGLRGGPSPCGHHDLAGTAGPGVDARPRRLLTAPLRVQRPRPRFAEGGGWTESAAARPSSRAPAFRWEVAPGRPWSGTPHSLGPGGTLALPTRPRSPEPQSGKAAARSGIPWSPCAPGRFSAHRGDPHPQLSPKAPQARSAFPPGQVGPL